MSAIGEAPRPVSSGGGLAAAMAAARERVAESLRAGADGVTIARELTADVEAVVVALALREFERTKVGPSSGVALLATGGFGRGEFAPHSDLDLLFLCAESPGEREIGLARAILHPLWDAKIDAGHATRSFSEALELPATDLTAATALLDVRFLVGDRALADHFLTQYAQRVAGASPGSFVARLKAEQQARHSRFGETLYLLEPDLKSGPGGVRDLCAGRWAALARFGTGNPQGLVALGEMSARRAAAFEAAREWLLRARCAAHTLAGRKQDQLRFDLQEAMAPMFFGELRDVPGEDRVAVAPAVEALMHQYQRHARTIRRETERLLARAGADPQRVVKVKAMRRGDGVDPSFVLRDGCLEAREPGVFDDRPADLVRLFAESIEQDVPIGLGTLDLVAERAAVAGEAVRADRESAAAFLRILTDVRDSAAPSRLEQMQDAGVLAALVPEWEPVVGRVQHDVYHVYTVDQHSLYGIAMLKALARPKSDVAKEHPLVAAALAAVERREALYVAMLFHDIGKAQGKNHSLRGAPIAAKIARRLGLSDGDSARVERLVRDHLVMGHLSQRRDLEDPALVAHFARICGDPEGLRELFVLTVCDLACVGPGNLTTWKNDLLHQLFGATVRYLERGPERERAERVAASAERRREVAAELGESPDAAWLGALLAGFPDRYLIDTNADRIAKHVQLIRGRRSACALSFTHHEERGYSELVIVADDVPGLLARIAGVLYANRVDVLDAAIYSRAKPGGGAEAVDVFRVQRVQGGAIADPERVAAICRDLDDALSGRVAIEDLVASRPRTSSLFDRGRPEVPPTEVKIDNDISPELSVIDVFTEDRPGVLYTIARTLHEQGLDIQRSKVGVEADRVADIFYVRDKESRAKVVDPARLAAITDALQRALPRRGRA